MVGTADNGQMLDTVCIPRRNQLLVHLLDPRIVFMVRRGCRQCTVTLSHLPPQLHMVRSPASLSIIS